MKNAKNETRRHGYARPIFCLILVVTLVVSVLALSGTAVDPSVLYDVKIVSSVTHTAALDENGTLYVWGENEEGQFPGSDVPYSDKPLEVLTNVKDVAVSENSTFVVDSRGIVSVYGINPRTGESASASGDLMGSAADKVYARYNNYAYTTATGALYMGGDNEFGQLASGDTKESDSFVRAIDSGVAKLAIGRSFILALTDAGELYGWGSNSQLQLSETLEETVLTPTLIHEDIKDVSAGSLHSCIVKNDGSLWTIGNSAFCQTGTNDISTDVLTSSPLTKILNNVVSVSSGSNHNFAITETGEIYTWGYGADGQMGDLELVSVSEPVSTELDFVQIFSGDDTGFGINAEGKIYSWGQNPNYLLARSNSALSNSPELVLDTQMNWLYTEPVTPEQTPSEAPSTDEPTPTPAPPAPEEVPEETPVEKPEVSVVPFIDGGSDGSIRPEDDVTRAEFVKMVVAGLCDYDATKDYGATSFSDIPLGRWFENYIAYAELNELLSGYPDGTFKPNDPISRQEAAVVVAKAMKLNTAAAADYGFTDVSGWSAPYINALAAEGVLSGDGTGKFNPKNNITRAEAIKTVTAAQGFTPTDEEIALLVEGIENPYSDVAEDKWFYVYILAAQGLLNTK